MTRFFNIFFRFLVFLLTMKDKTINQEQEDKLKKLKEKTSDLEVKASIDKKLQGIKEPFNK